MDTSTVAARADSLGRRVVPRRFRGLEEKRRIMAEARAPGGSVAAAARAHGVNANLVFAWMRLEERGLLPARTRRQGATLLPVRIESTAAASTSSAASDARCGGERIEVVLADGTQLRVYGAPVWECFERTLRLLRS